MVTYSPTLQMTMAGKTFHSIVGAAGTGITVPIYSTTSPTFALWNPFGSNKLLVPLSIQLGVAATATPAITTLALARVLATGGSFASGLPIAAWTDATVFNGRLGLATGSGRVGVATTTLTTAATPFYELGFSQATASLVGGVVNLEHDFNDKIALEPGTLIHLVGTPLAPVETMVASISWEEYDYAS